MYSMKLSLITLLAMGTALILTACQSSATSELDGWVPTQPSRNLSTYIDHGDIETAAEMINAYLLPEAGSQDLEEAHWIVKLEADFGDGTGWTDISHLYQLQSVPLTSSKFYPVPVNHTYPSPGSYMLNARATYWDGAVVYLTNSQGLVQPVTVTVP